ncbi:NAD(P)-binding protein [Ustulina deusta]|nr:NAD(P)-binding protein [Ustulina deusta]
MVIEFQEYHRKGFHLIATARRPEAQAELADLGISILVLDVADADSIEHCHEEAEKINRGKLDTLVNKTGVLTKRGWTHTHPVMDLSIPEVRTTFDTNVFGIMAMCQTFIGQLIAAKGLIINISSLSSVSPYLFEFAYCASKPVLSTHSRLELAPFEVHVVLSITGTVKSNTASRSDRALPKTSLYAPVLHMFKWRLQLQPSLFGYGHSHICEESLSSRTWLANSLGERVMDLASWRTFRLPEIMRSIGHAFRRRSRIEMLNGLPT